VPWQSPSIYVLRMFGTDEAPVEVEGHGPLSNIERELAIGAFVVFPAAMFLFEAVVGELFDSIAEGEDQTFWFGHAPMRAADLDLNAGQADDVVAFFRFDILDLTGVAFAIEADDDMRDPGGGEGIEDGGLVAWPHLGVEAIEGGTLRFELGICVVGVCRGGVGRVGHFLLLNEKRPVQGRAHGVGTGSVIMGDPVMRAAIRAGRTRCPSAKMEAGSAWITFRPAAGIGGECLDGDSGFGGGAEFGERCFNSVFDNYHALMPEH